MISEFPSILSHSMDSNYVEFGSQLGFICFGRYFFAGLVLVSVVFVWLVWYCCWVWGFLFVFVQHV